MRDDSKLHTAELQASLPHTEEPLWWLTRKDEAREMIRSQQKQELVGGHACDAVAPPPAAADGTGTGVEAAALGKSPPRSGRATLT